MSQNNLHKIIQQQQEQMAAMQVQIQALLAAVGGGGGEGDAARGPMMDLIWRWQNQPSSTEKQERWEVSLWHADYS